MMHQLISPLYFKPEFYREIADKEYFKPDLSLDYVTDLPIDIMLGKGFKCMLTDWDNTWAEHHNFSLNGLHDRFFYELALLFKVVIVSNNNSPRGRRDLNHFFSVYARDRNLENIYVVQSQIKKPSPEPFEEGLSHFRLQRHEAFFVGDNSLTDIVGANMMGIYSVKVKPLSRASEPGIFSFGRMLENYYLNRSKK